MNYIDVIKTFNATFDYEIKNDDSPAKLLVAYTDVFEGWESRLPILNSALKDLPGVTIQEIKTKLEEGGQITVSLHGEGGGATAPGRQKEPWKRYDFEISTTDESIVLADKYDTLTLLERKGLASIANGQELDELGRPWEAALTGALAADCLGKLRHGMLMIKRPMLVYVERSVATDFSGFNFTLIGKKDNPPGPMHDVLPGHWLYLGSPAKSEKDGKSWAVEKRWLFGITVWDGIYDPV